MDAYSMDLRERVMAAWDAGDRTRAEVAARFSVSVSWLRDLIRRRRDTGSIAAKPHGGGRAPAFDSEATAELREAVRRQPDATLVELAQAAGVACLPSVVHRALVRGGITRKKSPGVRPSRTGRS